MNIHKFYRPGEERCVEPLHYKECGLDNIILTNGFQRTVVDGEEYMSITDMDGLHRAIGLHIVLTRKAPSGAELRFLRSEMDMSQSDLARVLGTSDQSVARWEKGKAEIPGPAVLSMRMIYLLSLLPRDERNALIEDLLPRLERISQRDEVNDQIVLSYDNNNDQWFDKALAA